jgi:hypothetical protein
MGVAENQRFQSNLIRYTEDHKLSHHLLLFFIFVFLPTLITLSGVGTTCFHHVVIKIRHLKLEWMLTTANATGTNSLTCLPKHGGARDNNYWSPIQWPLWSLLSFRVQTLSALIARPTLGMLSPAWRKKLMLDSVIATSGAAYYPDLVSTRTNFRAFRRFCNTYHWTHAQKQLTH